MQRSRIGLWMVAVALLVTAVATAGPPRTITVHGENDEAVDRQAIQNAIDAAESGDTVELAGTFQLDGQRIYINRSRITLTGEAVDNDLDEAVNEDWVDGLDNDGDGEVDEDDWDTVVKGIKNPDGSPAGDTCPTVFNRGLVVIGLNETHRKIVISNLKFTDFHRALEFHPETDCSDSLLCESCVVTQGALDGVTVEGNRFDNNNRAAQALGQVSHLTFRRNVVTGGSIAVLTVGERVGCRLPDCVSSAANHFPGRPTAVDVSDNRIEAWEGDYAVLSVRSNHTTMRRNLVKGRIDSTSDFRTSISENTVLDTDFAIWVWGHGAEKITVLHNQVQGGRFPFGAWGDTPGSHFANNRVVDAETIGLWFLAGANGVTALNNEFINTADEVHIHLGPTTFDNKVIATDFTTTVVDEGSNNMLVGTLAMVNNPGVPDEVRAQLEELREELANKHQ